MTSLVKFAALAALLTLVSSAAVGGSAPIADSVDPAVRDSTFVDLLGADSQAIQDCT